MNREEFFKQLEQQLRRIPKDEAQEAMEYYTEYFDEAGPDNEAKVIEELGSPAKIVTKLKAETAMKEIKGQDAPTVKKGISAIWWVLLAICAAPIALPLAIAAVAIVIALSVAALSIIAALVVAVIAFFGAGILALVAGICVFATNLSTGIFSVGVGLVVLGVTLLLGILVVLAARGIFSGIAKLMNRTLVKHKEGRNHDE